MDRLTEYTGRGYVAYDPIDTVYDFSEINLQKLIDKLAHYEDLEEAGRLVVLPEGFDKEKFIYSNCPSYILLEDHCHGDCKECWEAALKSRK